MLEIDNLCKTFEESNNHQVLKNISLSVKDGEFVCILGPSGCGKSVLLYSIAGFIKPTEGDISLDNKHVEGPGTERILIFQDYFLFPWKTVYGNVMFGLEKSKLSTEQKAVLVNKYLDMVGLTKFKDWYPYKLSGGMRQRVAFARALIADPKMLLMDEPFAALDSQYRKYMRKSIESLWQKNPKTILFVTHSINEAIYLADTIYVLSSLPAEVKQTYRINLARPRDPRSAEFIELAKQIEKDVEDEFAKSVEAGPLGSLTHEEIIQNLTT